MGHGVTTIWQLGYFKAIDTQFQGHTKPSCCHLSTHRPWSMAHHGPSWPIIAHGGSHRRCLPEPARAILQELRGSAHALVSRVPPHGYAQPQPALQPGSSYVITDGVDFLLAIR